MSPQESIKGKSARVQGLVIPAQWDDKGNVVGVVVAAYDEQEYLVEGAPKADELLCLVQREVEIVGRFRGTRDGRTVIRLENFRLRPLPGEPGACPEGEVGPENRP
ncbi:MAG: hypothetical protein KKB20_26610 [Proteobacteria bacterium]|nr:hypothetical protein [Pseudomonadota bacterium]